MGDELRKRGIRVEISAGLLAFRRTPALEVLLAHPGGPFWAKKDDGAWTIPKGLAEADADLLATARREFTEETNLNAAGAFIPLAPVKQKSGKVVHAWAFEADLRLDSFVSNTFEMDWPPRLPARERVFGSAPIGVTTCAKSGRRRSFPEIDRIAYFSMPVAMTKIVPYQQPLLVELQAKIEHEH